MRGYAVSNIAWPFADRHAAYGRMAANGIAGLEIAPGLLFADAADPFDPPADLRRLRLKEISDAGLAPVSMQSLLFGVSGVALFGTAAQRMAYLAALKRAIRLAGELAIPHLVLGSPRERAIPTGMTLSEASAIAAEILEDLADHATAHGCRIGLEPNPEVYGTNFATHTHEADRIVRKVARPGLCLTLDIGNLHVNGEIGDLERIVAQSADLLGHVHLSEPDLNLAPAESATAARVIAALLECGYAGWISIEMRSAGLQSLAALDTALETLGTAWNQAGGRSG